MALNIASRICSTGSQGGISVSGPLKDLMIGSGLAFAPLGTYELKGVPGEWSLCSLVEPDQ